MNRRGFTLIELVSSLFVTGVVIVAMASSIGLVSRALPDASKPTETAVALQRVLDVVAADVRYASAITISNNRGIALQLPDRDGNGEADLVKYAWAGTAGDPLTRTHADLGSATLVASADQVNFAWAADEGSAAQMAPRLVCTIRIGMTELTCSIRCLNAEAP